MAFVPDQEQGLQQMRRFSSWLLLLLAATFAFQDYWNYSTLFREYPQSILSLAAGHGLAPQQYRIGLVYLARFLSNLSHGHLSYRHFFAIFDFIAILLAGWCVRETLMHTRGFLAASTLSRWVRLMSLMGLAMVYFTWSYWYQRPETWTSALFVAASMFLISQVRTGWIVVSGLILLAMGEAFIRADVAILFHFALFVYVLFRGARGFLVSRRALLVASFFGGLLPAVILWVLMHKVFPHATYGNTPVFQLLRNLAPSEIVPFALFIVPTVYTFLRGDASGAVGEGQGHTLLLASALYFVSWAILGRIEEVRIFIPFAFALMPQTVNAVAAHIHVGPHAAAVAGIPENAV